MRMVKRFTMEESFSFECKMGNMVGFFLATFCKALATFTSYASYPALNCLSQNFVQCGQAIKEESVQKCPPEVFYSHDFFCSRFVLEFKVLRRPVTALQVTRLYENIASIFFLANIHISFHHVLCELSTLLKLHFDKFWRLFLLLWCIMYFSELRVVWMNVIFGTLEMTRPEERRAMPSMSSLPKITPTNVCKYFTLLLLLVTHKGKT